MNILNDFKESLRKSMIMNFEKDGFLAPVLFFLQNNTPCFALIPRELLASNEKKEILADIIKKKCFEPNVFAAGIIMEANAAKIDIDSSLAKLVDNGDIRVSELKEKVDIIVLIFSTPEGEEIITYVVDCEKKVVGEPFSEGYGQLKGKFSGFFSWNKN